MKNKAIRIILMITTGFVSIYADNKINYPINDNLDKLTSTLFSTVTVIAGIWISCYLLFFQIYKDRYPIKIIREKYLPDMRNNFMMVIYCIVYGCIVIAINNGIVSSLWFCIISLSTTISILLKVYKTNKSLMINTYVDDFCKDLQQDIENNSKCFSEKTFSDIKYILDECIVKEEYYIVQNITEKTSDIFRTYLSNTIGMVNKGFEEDKIEKSFIKIIDINMYQLELCSKINSELLIKKIIKQQEINLKFCIKTKQYEWFKKYFLRYNKFVYISQKDSNLSLVTSLYSIYTSIFLSLINSNKVEWFRFGMNELMQMTSSLIFTYNNINICSYANFLSTILSSCINIKDDSFYDLIIDNLKLLTRLICKTKNGFNDTKVSYALIFNELLDKNPQKAMDFFEIFSDCSNYTTAEDTTIIEFKFFCISELYDKNLKLEENDQKRIFEEHIKTINNIISLNENYNSYLLMPDFSSKIFNEQYSTDRINNIIDVIEKLLNRCIIKDNFQMFYILLNEVNTILSKTEIKHTNIQKKLFHLYIWLIIRTKSTINEQFIELVFYSLYDTIVEIDKNRAISNSFCDYIIDSLVNYAKNGNSDYFGIITKVINTFNEFLDENNTSFFVSSTEKKKKIYKGIFNIGTNCIENNFEEGLKRVSNFLGWQTIYSIKTTTNGLTTYLLDRAFDLYNLSKNLDVSPKAQTFILTLFTTVGTYCCKDSSLSMYLNKITSFIKDEDFEKIKMAVNLRTSENDMWNSLFEGRTKQLTESFLKEIENVKKHT